MGIASNGNNMEQWQDMEISLEKPTDLAPTTPISNGLDVTPNLLHDEFHQQAGHLTEVEQLHSHVLVTAGMLPLLAMPMNLRPPRCDIHSSIVV